MNRDRWCRALALLVIALSARARAQCSYTRVGGFDIPGAGPGSALQLLAVDAAGDVFVGDSDHGTITKYDTAGNQTSSWTTGSAGSSPLAITVDPSGHVFVADAMGGLRIQEFDTSGNVVSTLTPAVGSDSSPAAIAVDSSGDIFIAFTNSSASLGPNTAEEYDPLGNPLLGFGDDSFSAVAVDGNAASS